MADKHTQVGFVESVAPVTGTKQDGSGTYTRFDVKIAGTKYVTFDAALGNSIPSFVGQQAEYDFTEKQNGQFTNRYLEAIRPANAGTRPEPPQPPPDTEARGARAAASGSHADKDRQIARMAAVKAAAALLSGTGATVNDLTAAASVVETWIFRPHLRDEDIPF